MDPGSVLLSTLPDRLLRLIHRYASGGEQSLVVQQYNERSRPTSKRKRNELRVGKEKSMVFQKLVNGATLIVYANLLPPGGTVIDLACGPFTDGPKYLQLGMKHYFGVDIANDALKEARHRDHTFRQHRPKLAPWVRRGTRFPQTLRFAQVDLSNQKVTLPDGFPKAHMVVCKNALHYIDHLPGLFSHVRQDLMHPQVGHFVVLCIDPDVMFQKTDSTKTNVLPDWFHVRNETPDDYEILFEGLHTSFVKERKLYPSTLLQHAKNAGLKLVASRSVQDTIRTCRSGFPMKYPWPDSCLITEQEDRMLQSYRFYVFCHDKHE